MYIDAKSVQGLVLPGFSQSEKLFLFFKIENLDKTNYWLKNLSENITSCLDLIDPQTCEVDSSVSQLEQDHSIGVLLTARGCKKLKIEEPLDIDSLFRLDLTNEFQRVMNATVAPNFHIKHQSIDFVIVVGFDHILVQEIIASIPLLTEGSRLIAVEFGKNKLNSLGQPIEHFGFRDPVSQPIIDGVVAESKYLRTFQERLSQLKNIDIHEPSELLFSSSNESINSNVQVASGTFSFFWKIRQFPENFSNFIEREYEKIKVANLKNVNDIKDFKKIILGSHGDYTISNSHIQKLKQDANSLPIMLRRGCTFSYDKNQGLLFLSFHKNVKALKDRFTNWMNNSDFPSKGAGKDIFGSDLYLGSSSHKEYFSLYAINAMNLKLLELEKKEKIVESLGYFPLFCPGVKLLQTLTN